jgi:HEAT repeat protein
MCNSVSPLLVIFLAIGVCFAGHSYGQEKEEAKKTPFQETAESVWRNCGLTLIAYGHFPYFTSWCQSKWGENIDAEQQKRFESFPDALIKALNDRDSADQESAIEFVAHYVGFARSDVAYFSRINTSEKDLARAADSALSPYTAKIKKALGANLMAKPAKTRLNAAAALLALDSSDVEANKTFQAGMASADPELLWRTSQLIAQSRFTSPQAIGELGRMLKHRDRSVRETAAGAIITMGTFAKDLAPSLIEFLETDKAAEGEYYYPFSIGEPKTGNLALMALESLKEHAKPAVPAILNRFDKANVRDQVAMLAYLANVDQKDAACVALVRKALQSENPNLKLAAACALLHLKSGDRAATDLLKKALADETKWKRGPDEQERTSRFREEFERDETISSLAFKMLQRFGPPSSEIVRRLVLMLGDTTEEMRFNALFALARIGPPAKEAVPVITMLLARPDDEIQHNYQSTEAATYALAKIRGKEAAAALVRVADSKASGALYAMKYLPELADDLPPNTLAVLVRAIQKENGSRVFAAVALSNLGERARPVRREMERLLDDPEVGWILDTALRRMPVQP